LYNKYRSDYQVEDILAGKATDEIKNRAKSAKFDERYSLLGLLLEAVMADMKEADDMEDLLGQLLVILKQYKKSLSADKSADGAVLLENLRNEQKKLYNSGMKSKSLSDTQQTQMIRIMDILSEEQKLVKADSSGKPFAVVKADFDSRVKAFNKRVKETSERISNMFHFGDEVFPEGQELIILVTELTANPYSARFIGKYHVEEYFIHDKELMFRQRQIEISGEIKKLELDD
jgi:hypothetical protein